MNEQDPIQALATAMEQGIKTAFLDGVKCGMEKTLERLKKDNMLITPDRVRAIECLVSEREVLALRLIRAEQAIELLGGVADDRDDPMRGNLQFKH